MKPCTVDGCEAPRHKQYGRCLKHMQALWKAKNAKRAAAQGRTVGASPGRKPEGCVVIVRKGKARRWVNGVMVQEVELKRGKLHRHTREILKQRGYRVEVR